MIGARPRGPLHRLRGARPRFLTNVQIDVNVAFNGSTLMLTN